MMIHIPTCHVAHARPCPAQFSLHGEPVGDHWWSGWPGAWCAKCGTDDPAELCLADRCVCPCHEDT